MSTAARSSAAAIALIACAGLIAQFISTGGEHPDKSALGVIWILARFFTILTNLMIAVTFTRIALGRMPGAFWLGGVTLWIVIVGTVYWLLLAGTSNPVGIGWFANQACHTATPVLTALWWLAFAPKAPLTIRDALLWILWPMIYCVYALVRGLFEGIYPYFFIDPTTRGYGGVAIYVSGLAVAFFIAGVALVGIARLMQGQPDRPG